MHNRQFCTSSAFGARPSGRERAVGSAARRRPRDSADQLGGSEASASLTRKTGAQARRGLEVLVIKVERGGDDHVHTSSLGRPRSTDSAPSRAAQVREYRLHVPYRQPWPVYVFYMQFTTGLTAYQNVVKSYCGGVHWTRPAVRCQRHVLQVRPGRGRYVFDGNAGTREDVGSTSSGSIANGAHGPIDRVPKGTAPAPGMSVLARVTGPGTVDLRARTGTTTVHRILTVERGRSADRYRRWVADPCAPRSQRPPRPTSSPAAARRPQPAAVTLAFFQPC
jgi:hypothetical protein